MGTFSLIAVVLLTLVGYSSGNVLAGRAKRVAPALGDLLVMVALWVVAVRGHAEVGRWRGIALGLALGLVVGAVVGALRKGATDGREKLAYLDDDAPPVERGFMPAWRRFAAEMGNFQGRMIMGVFYFVIVTPFGLISRMIGDGRGNAVSAGSFWRERPATPLQLEQAKNQF